MKKSFLLIGILLVFVIAGTYAWFSVKANAAADEGAAPALQTAKVRSGDIVITANGAGTVIPSAQVDLAFRSAGVLSELNVSVGDAVQSEQVLARLDASQQAEADFQALFSPQGATQAELAVANAKDALEDDTNTLAYLMGSNAWYWQGQLNKAQAALTALGADASTSQKEDAQKVVDDARARVDYYLSLQNIPEVDLALARADVESSKVALLDAQTALQIVQGGPDALQSPLIVLGTETDRLEQARLALENSQLVAPFDGAVIALDAIQGQPVTTAPVMTISTINDLLVRFYLDETDIAKAEVGMPVDFTFDAYSDTLLRGEIILVEPALQIVDGTPVLIAWAALPDETPFAVVSGMTVDVEVIAAEARSTLLVPAQALRELAPGSYAVFVVAEDGQLQMTPVTVGLRDYANAEILSGVQAGDLVSTGTVETE